MRRLLILTAAICVLALAALALASRPVLAPGDDIIIKGGSLEIQCGSNHGKDCLDHTSGTSTYTHTKKTAHITKIMVLDDAGATLYSSPFDAAHQPQVAVTFK
jgi:hypothetical protein